MKQIPDFAERRTALDPLRSFCVTAPAGSGKTELLIQRYLTLLARVQQPEQVLAITFTRKAAAEMRERILLALERGGDDEAPAEDHARLTWELARGALAADENRQWFLRSNPSRLNIRTIDGYCASLAKQLPVLSGFGGAVNVTNDPGPCYREAARALLDELERGGTAAEGLSELLLLQDNNWPLLERLLVRLLARRDQWLAYIGSGLQPLPAEQALKATLTAVVEDGLETLLNALGVRRAAEAWSLLHYSTANLSQPTPPAFAETGQESLPFWRSLADLFLTKEGKWRSRLTKANGFPTDAGDGKAAATDWKQRHAGLLAELQDSSDLLVLLRETRALPVASDKGEDWRRVIGLSHLLPRLAALLSVVFQQQGVVDYPQVALAAREALGDDDNPTDLALKLDYSLQHILLDEFQDTSMSQFELVRRLTREWADDNRNNPDNPRTFFVVGDGMQSIYGFRDADVGLFMHAREFGFNQIKPDVLTLRSNFRSDTLLVDWANQTFRDAFPRQDNIARAEITFSAAEAVRVNGRDARVSQRAFVGEAAVARRAEAQAVADVIAEGLAMADKSIAVLVRNRSHLAEIVAVLKERGIQWRAEDIDPLAGSEVVIDLLNLCRALHNEGDRLAWLALLRAPWAGLTLQQLLMIAGEDSRTSIWLLLQRAALSQTLDEDGAARAGQLCAVLRRALQLRERLGLRDWIQWTWEALGGPASVSSAGQLEDAAEFFELLEQFDNRGEGYREQRLLDAVNSLYSSASEAGARVHLMTLHKSKGLEFDRVIIPGLARAPRGDERELLLWGEFHNRGETGFLLAVDDPLQRDDINLYNFLRQDNARKRALESTRLLYVGATRAVQQLHLFATLKATDDGEDYKPPAAASLLHCIWPNFEKQMEVEAVTDVAEEEGATVPRLRRLRLPVPAPQVKPPIAARDENIPQMASNLVQRATGTVVHEGLQRLSYLGADELAGIDLESWSPWLELRLRELHVADTQLAGALQFVQQNLACVLGDERGRWVIAAERDQALCEYPISTLREDGRLLEMVVDRSFVADGTRWIVDYKSARPADGEPLEDFLQRERGRYREQLQNYREAFQQRESIPVKTALYFTAIPHWLEL